VDSLSVQAELFEVVLDEGDVALSLARGRSGRAEDGAAARKNSGNSLAVEG
jgi:hypothetical protein